MRTSVRQMITKQALPESSSARARTIHLFLFMFIVMQPILDIASFWLIRLGSFNYTIAVRIFLLLYGLFLCLRYGILKSRDRIFLGALSLFIVAGTFMKARIYLDFSYFSELQTAVKLFYLPVMIIILLRLTSDATEPYTKTIINAFNVGALLIIGSVILSLVTNTHSSTYSQPWAQIGLNGWFYSGNQQSLILVSILPFFLYHAFHNAKIVVVILNLLLSWCLLNFNGSRTAWLGSIAINLVFIGLIAAEWLFKRKRSAKVAIILPVLLISIVASVTLRPYLPINVFDQRRTGQIQHETEREQSTANESQDHEASDFDHDGLSAHEWSLLTTNERQGMRTNYARASEEMKIEISALFHDYATRLDDSSAAERIDERYRERIFVLTALERANLSAKLIGIPHQTISSYIGDVETDYIFVLGSYGLVGSILFFLYPLLLGVAILRKLAHQWFRPLLQWEVALSSLVVAMLLFLAHFAGRSFQQPSVSSYLAVVVIVLFNETVRSTESVHD